MNHVVFEKDNIQLTRSEEISNDFVNQIEQTTLGSVGQLRYQYGDAAENAKKLQQTSFLELKWKSRLIGCIALSRKEVRISDQRLPVLYVRYFSISGLLKSRQGQAGNVESKSSSLLKSFIIDAFNDPERLSGFNDIKGIYAYVENNNLPSVKNVLMTGFKKVDSFSTSIYSRIKPRQKLIMKEASISFLQKEIFPLLDQFYDRQHLVPDWENLSTMPGSRYYYYEKNGEILSGILVSQKHWIIKEMPGFTGKLNQYFLSRVPLLNNIFFRDKLEFLTVEMVYVRNDHPHLLPDMIETVMHGYGLHHTMIWASLNSPLLQLVLKSGNLGLLQKLRSPTSAGIYFKSLSDNLSPDAPCYVSAEGIS
jgi:hypothetical protein